MVADRYGAYKTVAEATPIILAFCWAQIRRDFIDLAASRPHQQDRALQWQGEALCFVHVLLNALDMHQRGMIVKIIIEGQAVKLPPELQRPDHTFHDLYARTEQAGLIEGVCKACATKMGTIADIQAQGLPLLEDMSGHPSLGRYLAQGFTILTF
ncbi:MAG: transposase [Deltaproteobacteria bacterium]|nr:transposase [Deltaproteobacteria bacterium]